MWCTRSPIDQWPAIGHADRYAERASAKGLSFVVSLNTNEQWWVHGDPNRLRQVLTNIVGNALKFTEEGSIKLSVEHRETNTLRFVVRDTGIGMAPEAKTSIFEAFSQADSSTTRVFGGSGLGLAISKRLVELMGGEIGFESDVGSGTTFWINLELPPAQALEIPQTLCEERISNVDLAPARKENRHSSDKPIDTTNALKTRILVVDDNEMNRELATAMFESMGCEVELRVNGKEGAEGAIAGRFDLLLMDCQMPVMDGFKATQEIRAHEQSMGSPRQVIVACTANAMSGDSERCFNAGMDDYVSKPFTWEDIEKVLQKWTSYDGDSRARPEQADPSREPAQDATGLLDQEALDEIRGLSYDGMPNPLNNYIEIFLRNAPTLLDAIRSAVIAKDASGLVIPAHSLKSDSANLGAKGMANYCRQLEEMGRTATISDANEVLVSLENVFATVCEELQALKA